MKASDPPPTAGFFFHGDGQAMMATVDNISTGVWLGDTGASHHTTHDMDNYTSFSKLNKPYKIQQVQGDVLVTHSGSVILITESAHGPIPLRLNNVLYIPTMYFNILSLQKLVDANYVPVFGEIPQNVVVKKVLQSGQVKQIALMIVLRGRLTLDCTLAVPSLPITPSVYVSEISMLLLHRRLGQSGQPATGDKFATYTT